MKIRAKVFLKCSLWSIAEKLENIWTKIFLQEVDQELCGWNSICQILILSLWLMTPPFFLVKISQILQKLIAFFPERGEEIKTSFWHMWIAQFSCTMAEVFPHYGVFFSILAIFRRKRGVQVGPKVLTLGPSSLHKYLHPSKNFLLQYYLWWEFRQYRTIFGEKGPKNLPKRSGLWMLNRYTKF